MVCYIVRSWRDLIGYSILLILKCEFAFVYDYIIRSSILRVRV